jgi:hypothetical protein
MPSCVISQTPFFELLKKCSRFKSRSGCYTSFRSAQRIFL